MCNAPRTMIKISRNNCLIKFRNFPLRDFENDDEIYFHPKFDSSFWLKLEKPSLLSKEIVSFYKKFGVENLVVFGDYDRAWISEFTRERNDDSQLTEALKYFNKLPKRFNGALKINIGELAEFLNHFIVLTKLDGGFTYYNFLDESQNLLGFIHYSGEVNFTCLKKKTTKIFLEKIRETKFLDTMRNDSSRLEQST